MDSDDEMETEVELDTTNHLGKINEINTLLDSNPYQFELHAMKIQLYQELMEYDQTRSSREQFSGIFPLPSTLWLSWINDEKLMASTKDEKHKILDLYTRALNDFYSIEIWVDCIEFVIDEYTENNFSADETSEILSKAVEQTKYDFLNSHQTWDLYLQFLYEHAPDVIKTRQMFIDRLSHPHMKISETSNDYSAFESENDPENYIDRMSAVQKIILKSKENEKREAFELELKNESQERDRLDVFYQYLFYEKRCKSEFVGLLYERAISMFAYEPYLWTSYLGHLLGTGTDKLDDPVLITARSVAKRSVRNSYECMSSSALWSYCLRIESLYEPKSKINALFDRGMYMVESTKNHAKVSELLSTKLLIDAKALTNESLIDSKKVRSLDSKTSKTEQESRLKEFRATYRKYLLKLIPLKDETNEYILQRTMAKIEAFLFKDFKQSFLIFESLAKQPLSLSYFLDYLNVAEKSGDLVKLRLVFNEALKKPREGNEIIYQRFVQFEEHNGFADLNKALDAVFRARERDQLAENFRLKRVSEDQDQNPKKKHKKDNEQNTDQDQNPKTKHKKEVEQNTDQGQEYVKEKEKKEGEYEKKPEAIGNMKTYKVVYTSSNAGNMAYFKDLPSTTTTETIQEIGGKYGRIVDAYLQPSESGSLEAFIEYQFSDSVKKLVLSGPYNIDSTEIQPIRCRPLDSKWNFSNSEQKDTIYVSNLSIDCTKITLRELFSVHGKIKDIRLITTKNGYSFAYIQFQTAETAQGSLKSSGTKICGKPITVAISNPQKRKVHEIDEKELYISNLPKSITKEDILELFSGMDVDIRFPSIGFCFVSFKDVSQARKGLEFNGKIMDGKPIIVSVSDPNARKKKEEYKRFETGNATMFKPRVVVTAGVKTSVKKVHVDVKKVVAKSTVKDKGKEKGQEKSMTNADFRKMFLDSK